MDRVDSSSLCPSVHTVFISRKPRNEQPRLQARNPPARHHLPIRPPGARSLYVSRPPRAEPPPTAVHLPAFPLKPSQSHRVMMHKTGPFTRGGINSLN